MDGNSDNSNPERLIITLLKAAVVPNRNVSEGSGPFGDAFGTINAYFTAPAFDISHKGGTDFEDVFQAGQPKNPDY